MAGTPIPLDRLIRKEVSLGAIREKLPPQDHVGISQIAPFLEVATDDVIFDYIKDGTSVGLAPARAEDAEAELAQTDQLSFGQGRAAVIDWSLKDRYSASDVTRYRESLLIQQQLQGAGVELDLNFTGRTQEDFLKRIARDDTRRRRKLDNRLEWMIWSAVENGTIVYNDGKIKFGVDYKRPAAQQNQAPAGGLWSTTTCDPIGDINAMNTYMFNTYGVRLKHAYTSQRVLNSMWNSDRFVARTGLVVASGGTKIDPNYLLDGWGPEAAQQIIERATNVQFKVYDSVYRTRAIGGTTMTNNRFNSDNKIYFLPEASDLGEIDDTDIGFAKTLTAPHPEGDWQAGYYEWEDSTKDPWTQVRGSGLKAFPVFPYMEYSYTMSVLP